jgi:DNA-binding transcriptional MerR regulator
MKSTSRQLTIQQLSDQLQIPKSTLRFWEKEFHGYIEPERTVGGQRRYTERHVLRFDQIKRMREKGQRIYDIKRALTDFGNPEDEHQHVEQIKLISNRIGKLVSDEIYHLLSFELGRRV